MEEGLSDNLRTLNLIKEQSNKLVSGLNFTVDCQEMNDDNKCPMLDLKVWREHSREGCAVIRHTYY